MSIFIEKFGFEKRFFIFSLFYYYFFKHIFFIDKKVEENKMKHSFDVEFPQDSISDGFGTFWALLMAATSTYIIFEFHFFFHLPNVVFLAKFCSHLIRNAELVSVWLCVTTHSEQKLCGYGTEMLRAECAIGNNLQNLEITWNNLK